MSEKTPRVALGYQEAYLLDPRGPGSSLRLDTPAWVLWLGLRLAAVHERFLVAENSPHKTSIG